ALEAASPQVIDVKVAEGLEGGVGGEPPPDEIRLLQAREDPGLQAGRGPCQVEELPPVRRVADGACRDGVDHVGAQPDRKSGGEGKSVDLGGRRIIKKSMK